MKLEKCPACGSEAELDDDNSVYCTGDECAVYGPSYDPDGFKWNNMCHRLAARSDKELRFDAACAALQGTLADNAFSTFSPKDEDVDKVAALSARLADALLNTLDDNRTGCQYAHACTEGFDGARAELNRQLEDERRLRSNAENFLLKEGYRLNAKGMWSK